MRRLGVVLTVVLITCGCAHLGSVPPNLQAQLGELPQVHTQAITVVPNTFDATRAQVTMWERVDSQWSKVEASMPAVIGRNGIAPRDAKREGDGRVPSGMFDLRRAFGYDKSVDTGLSYRQVTSSDYWVDDPTSDEYNLWVSRSPKARSFETLRRNDDLYKYAVVIEYNTDPIVRGAGSAIFLHVWRNADTPTAGCVALAEENVRSILAWLNSEKDPVIFIQTHDQ